MHDDKLCAKVVSGTQPGVVTKAAGRSCCQPTKRVCAKHYLVLLWQHVITKQAGEVIAYSQDLKLNFYSPDQTCNLLYSSKRYT